VPTWSTEHGEIFVVTSMQCSMLFGAWAAETAACREELSCYRTATGMSAVLSRGTDGFDLFGRELRRAASLAAAAHFGFAASKLAGLSSAGDFGAFITSSE
jgi:hypothetical protein